MTAIATVTTEKYSVRVEADSTVTIIGNLTSAASAAGSAATAGAAAGTATTQAGLASSYATTAQGYMTSALSYRDDAQAAAGTATTQAGIATTAAATATTQAGLASGYATNAQSYMTSAQGYRDTAQTAAGTATTQAGLASGYADAAAASAAAAAAAVAIGVAAGTLPASFTTLKASEHIALAATKRLYMDGIAATGDTYLVESSANVLSFYVGGVATLVLQPTGVGIGTASPSYPLHVKSAAGAANYIVAESPAGYNNGFLGSHTGGTWSGGMVINAGNIDFYTSALGNIRLTVKDGGNVAIGATSKLYLDGVAATGDTYLVESSANVLDLYAGGVKTLSLTATGAAVTGTLSTTGALSASGTANDGVSLFTSSNSGTGRALQVIRSVAAGTRPVATISQTSATGGTQAALLVHQADTGEVAIGVNEDGSLTSFKFKVLSNGDTTARMLSAIHDSGGYGLTVRTNDGTSANNSGVLIFNVASATAGSRRSILFLDPNGGDGSGGDYFALDGYGSGTLNIANEIAGGATNLKIQGTTILQASSTGVAVTGNLSASGNLSLLGQQPGVDTPATYLFAGFNTNWPLRLQQIYDANHVEYFLWNGQLSGTKATPTSGTTTLAKQFGIRWANSYPLGGGISFFHSLGSVGSPLENVVGFSAAGVGLKATNKLYLDGIMNNGDTYLVESSSNVVDIYVGGAKALSLTSAGATVSGTIAAAGDITTTVAGSAYVKADNTASDLRCAIGATGGSGVAIYSQVKSSGGPTPLSIIVGSSTIALVSSAGVAITGTLSTIDPAGGAGPAWKLGVAAAVSPTSPNRTLRVDVAGASYYLAAKTTND